MIGPIQFEYLKWMYRNTCYTDVDYNKRAEDTLIERGLMVLSESGKPRRYRWPVITLKGKVEYLKEALRRAEEEYENLRSNQSTNGN